MRLLIISHTPHFRQADRVVGWGPTVREIDHLSSLFDSVVHVAPLNSCPPKNNVLPYTSPRIRFQPVLPAGGTTLKEKLGILTRFPGYCRAIRRELRQADVVHVRSPANISLLALLLLALRRSPNLRWFKYAGNWRPAGRESWSYTLQRWWLNTRLHKGLVTVNGRWPEQPEHVVTFYNPCLTTEELTRGREFAAAKRLDSPIRLLFVGRLEEAKGVGRALRVVGRLREHGVPSVLDLVGDGPARVGFEKLSAELNIEDKVRFHGWVPRPALEPLYAQSHLFLLPSCCSEGWPKVLSEGMAYGVVPVASNVSSIPQYLESFGTGSTLPADDIEGFATTIATYCSNAALWREESQAAVRAAANFTYDNYLQAVSDLLSLDEPSLVARTPLGDVGSDLSPAISNE